LTTDEPTIVIRVLELLVSTAPGGGPKHVYDLVRRLPQSEFEIVVAGPRDGAFFERFRDLTGGAKVDVVEIATNRLGLRPLRDVVRLIRDARIDLVASHGKGAGFYGRLAARWTGVAAVHTFHGIHYERYPGLVRAGYLALERRLARTTHTTINVSASQEREAIALGLCRATQCATILNGIDLAELDADLTETRLERARLGLAADAPIVGMVTRFDAVKRLDVLMRAMTLLAPRLPDLAVAFHATREDEGRISRLATDAGFPGRVIFLQKLARPGGAYRWFDLYVATSRKEGLPLALLEAMGARLAVVATDVPGHRDVVVHDETGLLVPPDDPSAVAEAVAELLGDPARRARMGEAGRRRVAERFAAASMVEKTAEVYRRAAAMRR
jgi:glycosyltransferase involved in cell wall biosynthesis